MEGGDPLGKALINIRTRIKGKDEVRRRRVEEHLKEEIKGRIRMLVEKR